MLPIIFGFWILFARPVGPKWGDDDIGAAVAIGIGILVGLVPSLILIHEVKTVGLGNLFKGHPSPSRIPGISPLRSSYVPYGIFFFNPADDGFDGQRAVRERTAKYDRRILDGEWLVHHGDMLLELTRVRHNIRAILRDKGCKLDRLDAALKTALAQSADPGYRPYVIGMTGVQFAVLEQADDRLRQDKVAGYKGLIFFALENVNRAMEVGSGFSLILSDINSHWY
jgi:hypothetical protein